MRCCLLILSCIAILSADAGEQAIVNKVSVGMPLRLSDVILPGTELEVIPLSDRKLPGSLRIVRTLPHGSAHRYEFEFQGFDPGTQDLRKYLRRKDGTSTTELPAIPVEVESLLPKGQILPTEVEAGIMPSLGGYEIAMIVAGVFWFLGFIWIVAGFFKRREEDESLQLQPKTVADRLKPLIEGAIAGKLSPTELAALERNLLAFWRKRLKLDTGDAAESMAKLRANPEAGPLLEQLEIWLHRPGQAEVVDISKLLTPYQSIAAEELNP
jgi:hypothetical protein